MIRYDLVDVDDGEVVFTFWSLDVVDRPCAVDVSGPRADRMRWVQTCDGSQAH